MVRSAVKQQRKRQKTGVSAAWGSMPRRLSDARSASEPAGSVSAVISAQALAHKEELARVTALAAQQVQRLETQVEELKANPVFAAGLRKHRADIHVRSTRNGDGKDHRAKPRTFPTLAIKTCNGSAADPKTGGSVDVPILRAFRAIRARGGIGRLGTDSALWSAVMADCIEPDSGMPAGVRPAAYSNQKFPELCHRYFEHEAVCAELERASLP